MREIHKKYQGTGYMTLNDLDQVDPKDFCKIHRIWPQIYLLELDFTNMKNGRHVSQLTSQMESYQATSKM